MRHAKRQTERLHKAWNESGKVYGRRKLHDDLLEQGESLCPNRVSRLAQLAGLKAQIGYRRRPGSYGGKPSVVVNNALDRQFDAEVRGKAWVTDITYIRTQKADSNGRRNTPCQEVFMATGRRKSERSTRRKLSSPGRPPVWQRENLCRFWRGVAAGLSSERPLSKLASPALSATCGFGVPAECLPHISRPRRRS